MQWYRLTRPINQSTWTIRLEGEANCTHRGSSVSVQLKVLRYSFPSNRNFCVFPGGLLCFNFIHHSGTDSATSSKETTPPIGAVVAE